MKPELYIKALLSFSEKSRQYNELNKQIQRTVGESDCPPNIQLIDDELAFYIVGALDDAFLTLTGHEELASYYLWDNPKQGIIHENCIHLAKGNIYMWDSPETFKATIYEMIKDKA